MALRVLVVCTGNTCRSPMGAGLLTEMLAGEIEVVSAGIMAAEGHPATPEAVTACAAAGIDISVHRAGPGCGRLRRSGTNQRRRHYHR